MPSPCVFRRLRPRSPVTPRRSPSGIEGVAQDCAHCCPSIPQDERAGGKEARIRAGPQISRAKAATPTPFALRYRRVCAELRTLLSFDTSGRTGGREGSKDSSRTANQQGQGSNPHSVRPEALKGLRRTAHIAVLRYLRTNGRAGRKQGFEPDRKSAGPRQQSPLRSP